jgi:hypothetical protein
MEISLKGRLTWTRVYATWLLVEELQFRKHMALHAQVDLDGGESSSGLGRQITSPRTPRHRGGSSRVQCHYDIRATRLLSPVSGHAGSSQETEDPLLLDRL